MWLFSHGCVTWLPPFDAGLAVDFCRLAIGVAIPETFRIECANVSSDVPRPAFDVETNRIAAITGPSDGPGVKVTLYVSTFTGRLSFASTCLSGIPDLETVIDCDDERSCGGSRDPTSLVSVATET